MSEVGRRKDEHLELCATDEVSFRGRSTLLEHVRLVHDALPDLSLDEVDLGVELLGKRLRAPLIVAGMTGGTDRAAEVNRALARLAQRRGYGFGVGSQRAMARAQDVTWTYAVRDVAPDVLLLGNLGVVQARAMSTDAIDALVRAIGADALCVHLNPAMELVQPEGDRDFREGTSTLARLVAELPVPVVAKETGCGIGPAAARKLRRAGVRYCDVSGAGGTSWVGVETLRAQGARRALGEALWDWGVPTAPSIVYAAREGLQPIATGGVRTGLDVARALALGAVAAGLARTVYQAWTRGGEPAADALLDAIEQELRAVMVLTGSRTIDALRRAPHVVTGELRDWLALDGDVVSTTPR
ncbi:MAG: type 2 isopentenyl-diphosphate Delta-isomerase [Myxococcota bacterium]|nr:type 2 isopentenyl-diphosphate Delta-isomerase [Myxococcota bacterium]MDW8361767.1 type 2 isopentenyl-diphosphate Delta-isomerase [Myxococcales bacterium]